ncbi:Adenine nucleotide alpha hydrolase-like superfamily protein [Forsythia ovata]|uniref:Adenine nucleotide alpha hydrolase-like superfamily protein n=1 Tax=Forsythia ovata TaxID=205694 RepID=A0ABD1NZU1_9LAMI
METTTTDPSAGLEAGAVQPSTTAEAVEKMKILVAIDDSEESFYALGWVLDNFFKQSLGGATYELIIIHVMEPLPNYIFPGAPAVYPTTSVVQSVNKVQQENASAILSHAVQICTKKKVKAKASILEGDPKEMICEAAELMQIDLIVVGSRGLGMIKRAFLGSVSDYVAHHAKCGVLIIKPSKESQK